MASYEKEVDGLQRLFEEVQTDDEPVDEKDPNEIDHVSIETYTSDTEQEIDESDSIASVTVDPNVKYFVGKDGTKWAKHCPSMNIKTAQYTIVKVFPGANHTLKHLVTPLDIFGSLFRDEIRNIIVESTNIKITSVQDRYSRERDCRPTTLIEIKASLGLLYLTGVRKINHLNVNDMWRADGTGIEASRHIIDINRFKFLLQCLRFDNIHTREERKQVDKLAPLRQIFDEFVRCFKSAYRHSELVTIDEKLEAFRVKCSFRQYMPKKAK
ncbi:hypothetical protein NQ314_010142 [Rhamnusium bicolor]|uniref:PiggyBac transposable element-derived protein domain-containing protein n=1 Tax=Rhamnusium bicolor TaxID=1586634 RepID=A0AAV8XSS8_9CUCU|nr:hypothetical protein NQ314_010142 [Rhamnusium bicolor]